MKVQKCLFSTVLWGALMTYLVPFAQAVPIGLEAFSGSEIAAVSQGNSLRDRNSDALLTIDFSTPVNQAGFLIPTAGIPVSSWEISAVDSSLSLLETIAVTQGGFEGTVFFGVERAENIARLKINKIGDAATSVTFIDDLRYESVPEPTTLALLGLGLAGIGFSRRRRPA